MRTIPLIRFDALGGYCRDPMARVAAEEIAWFEEGDESVLGALIRDRIDGDFGGIVLGRDEEGRFRWIGGTGFHDSPRTAKAELSAEMQQKAAEPVQQHWQGDGKGQLVDFFNPVVRRSRLNKDFLRLAEEEGYSPARGIIEPMMNWYEDIDGNFIEQFQTTGFDARLWELYLFATFVEAGFRIGDVHAVPDFLCGGPLGEFAVEATTVNPTQDERGRAVSPPSMKTMEETQRYLKEYMPIKYASTLTSKLKRGYWKKPEVAGKALLFAIMDFSSPASMVRTTSSLPLYLYGYDHDWNLDNGHLRIMARKVKEHRWGKKRIPSGFFELPGAENISAVLFSNSGTISKFNRMGVIAGFGSNKIRVFREGTAFDHDPNAAEPHRFRVEVTGGEYMETWVEGMDVYHNPHALVPFSDSILPGAAHHRLRPDGQISSAIPEWHPTASFTSIFQPQAGVDQQRN